MPDPVSSPESSQEDITAATVQPNGDSPNQDAQQAVSSTATETGTDAQPNASDKPAGGEAGDPDGAKERPKSIVEAARQALTKTKGAPASPAADATSQQPKTTDGKQKPAASATAEDPDKDLPFHKHPRWIERGEELKAARADAEKWQRFNELVHQGGYGDTQAVEGWLNGGTQLNQAGVSADERGLLLEFGVAAKTNPERAYEIIKPIYEALRTVIGDVLPADLQQAVDNGEMTEDHARRLAKSEAGSRIQGRRAQIATETVERTQTTQQEALANQAMATAVVSWEQRQASSNPDWESIAKSVSETVAMLRPTRNPRSPEDAVKLCDDALAFVMRTKGTAAQPRPTVKAPGTGHSPTTTQARPKSVLEAARMALAR